VFPGRVGPGAVAEAFEAVAESYDDVVVEESVTGAEIRFFYVEPHAVAVKMSVPPSIVGDGARSVMALIDAKNAADAEFRLVNQKPVQLTHTLVVLLAEQGLDLGSVPAAGQSFRVARTANGTGGGGHVECRDTIHPSWWTVAEAAFKAIPGLVIGTLDMIVADPMRAAEHGGYWILEVNSSPGLLPYHRPWQGRPQDVSGAIIAYLQQRSAAEANG